MNQFFYSKNKADTLLSFKARERELLYPLTKGTLIRGGAFWCLPNFDESGTPFTVRHGEYRVTEGESARDGVMTKNLIGPWGSLGTRSLWEYHETGLRSTLSVTSLTDETVLRPGFHPYFNTETGDSLLSLNLGETTLLRGEIQEGAKMIVPVNPVEDICTATLVYKNSKITLRFSLVSESKKIHHAFAFCVWTDNLSRYVCVEPVLGSQELKEGLPDSFLIKKGESVTLSISIDIAY